MSKSVIRKGRFISGRLILALMVAFSAFALSACISQKSWHVEEVTGHLPDLNFSLTADNGRIVTPTAYKEHLLLMYFGFTNCDSECPVSMARLARVMQLLGTDANRIRILFVTLDPERDTPQILRHYVGQFDSDHAIGLTGTTTNIERLTKQYRAAYRPRSNIGEAGGIDHGDAVYIFDSQRRARLLATSADSDEHLAQDLRRLLETDHQVKSR